MKAFAYLRVSGRSQIDGDGFPRQLAAIQAYAKANGIELAGIYREEGVSGTTEWGDRPAWSEMIASLNGCRTIIVERLDRLARDLMVQEHILTSLKSLDVELISTAEPDLCSDDPTRKLMRQIMGAIAEFDKSTIVLKLRAARQRQKLATGRCEGRKPYGHYPGEADTLAAILSLRRCARGCRRPTYAAVAAHLNAQGATTRSGTAWTADAVRGVLR